MNHSKTPWGLNVNSAHIASIVYQSKTAQGEPTEGCLALVLGFNTPEGEANTRLLMAAPEMLEALEAMLDAFGILRQGGVNVLAVPEAVKARELAHAAIKKARGES